MLNLLIVDDEKSTRIGLGMIINWREHGYELIGAAADGLQALEIIEKSNPDIVITDLNMPNMDGLELIRKLRERSYSGKIIVLSNYDEFELVREAMKLGAVDYILKVTLKANDLITVLEKTREQLQEERQLKTKSIFMQIELAEKQLQQKNSFWKELLQEKEPYIADVIREGEKLGISSEKVAGKLLFIKIDHYEAALTSGKIKNKKLLDFSVANIIKDTVSGKNTIEIVEIGNGQYAVILYLQDLQTDEALWQQSIRHLMHMLNLYLNLSVSVVLSDTYAGFDQLRAQFALCKEASIATFYHGAGSVLSVTQVSFHSSMLQSEYMKWSNEIKGAIDEDNDSRLVVAINTIIEQAMEAKCEPNALKRTFTMLLTDVEHMITKWVRNTGAMSEDRTHSIIEAHNQQIRQAETIDALHAAVLQGFIEANHRMQQVKSKQCRKEVLRIIEIIHLHLHSKVTLEMLSHEVNMNVSYLCRIFKQDVGKSIVQYINEMKINHAVELLKFPDARIKEVAAAIGIDDPFYFNRLFKKLVGVSPSDFRKRLFPSKESN